MFTKNKQQTPHTNKWQTQTRLDKDFNRVLSGQPKVSERKTLEVQSTLFYTRSAGLARFPRINQSFGRFFSNITQHPLFTFSWLCTTGRHPQRNFTIGASAMRTFLDTGAIEDAIIIIIIIIILTRRNFTSSKWFKTWFSLLGQIMLWVPKGIRLVDWEFETYMIQKSSQESVHCLVGLDHLVCLRVPSTIWTTSSAINPGCCTVQWLYYGVVLFSKLLWQQHFKCLLFRVRKEPSLSTQIVLFSLELVSHLLHVSVSETVDRPTMDVVSKVTIT